MIKQFAGVSIGVAFALVVSGHMVAGVAVFTLAYILLKGY